MSNVLENARSKFFAELVRRKVLTFNDYSVGKGKKKRQVCAASNADYNNRGSVEISNSVARAIASEEKHKKLPGQTLGDIFELLVAEFLEATFLSLPHLRPGRWNVNHVSSRDDDAVSSFEQYAHLADLAEFCNQNPALEAALGNDYGISPDVVITRTPETDEFIDKHRPFLAEDLAQRSPIRLSRNEIPILHACVSCKYTLRSDRAQNARSEALNLIRNRKGRTPHIVLVTAECFPSRLASVALGTGDIDCLYHIALPELIAAVSEDDFPDAFDMLHTMISGRRIRDLTDLPLDLAV